jgi:hypothetical protein
MIIRTLVATITLGAAAAGAAPHLLNAVAAPVSSMVASANVQAVAVAEMDTLGAGEPITPANITADLEANPVDHVTAGPSTSETVFSVAGSSDPTDYPGAGVAVMGGTGCAAAWIDATDPDLLAIDESPVLTVHIPAGQPCQALTLPPAERS